MAGANHEAGITVKVSTDGTEKLDAVARGMDELAQGAAEAAPKLKPIAEGVQQIGREAGIAEQARTLGALGDEARGAAAGVDALGKEARQAAAGVDTLGGGLGRLPALLGPIGGLVAGAFAVDKLAGFAASLGPIADAAKNLEARLALAVGAAGNLPAALDQVRASANATGSELNAIGDLFGALTRSTRELGTSQEDVAQLTDTINKSFAVSGTAAGAASGAITQLAQAFQSGALRGDEFNSVNEQAPRLMQALADGLGVARGELRAMAEQGALTTEVVLGALQSQAAAIDAEFSKLPDTIERAAQRMANNWQVFVGELDKTTGASDAVAGGLNMVAENLDEIASAAATAGEVVVTALAVKAAAALRGYVTLATAGTAATAAQTAALGGLAAAGQAATGALLTLGRALPGLAVAGAVAGVAALVVEFFRAKTAAEEADAAIEKMLAEPAQNAVAGEIELVATKAEALRFKLSEVELRFAELRAKGQDAAKALGTVVQAADIGSSDGIKALILDLDRLRLGAQVTGEQIDAALRAKLAQLSARELQEFRIQAEIAFGGAADAAERLAQINDAVLAVSFGKLGVNAAAALGQISPAAAEAIAGVDGIVTALDAAEVEAVQAAGAIELALGAAFKKADTLAAVVALNSRIQDLGEAGKIGAEAMTRLADASEAARRRIEDMTPGINSVEEAFRRLGVTSKAEMDRAAAEAKQAFEVIRDSGKATAEELRAAFTAYAEQAVAANGGVADATVKAQASALGLAVEVDKTGKVIVRTMAEAAFGVKGTDKALKDAAGSAGELGEAAKDAGKSMVEAAREQNAAVKSVTVSLVDATTAQSRYADEARRVASEVYNSTLAQARSFSVASGAIDGARSAARLYIEEMERLDAAQERFSSNAADGVEQLRLRLLELNGTEEQIAAARQSRDQAEVLRTIELTRLDLRRAELRRDQGEVQRLQAEINLLQEQLTLIEQIYRAEARQRTNASAPPRGSSSGSSSGVSAGGAGVQAAAPAAAAAGARQTTLNINLPGSGIFSGDRASLEAFARQLGPVITDLQRKGAL
jgi:tape measure domain-containing protein